MWLAVLQNIYLFLFFIRRNSVHMATSCIFQYGCHNFFYWDGWITTCWWLKICHVRFSYISVQLYFECILTNPEMIYFFCICMEWILKLVFIIIWWAIAHYKFEDISWPHGLKGKQSQRAVTGKILIVLLKFILTIFKLIFIAQTVVVLGLWLLSFSFE